MRKVISVVFLILAITPVISAQDKKLVAVLDFDYGTVRSAVQAYFGTDQDVGKGISLLLEQKLVQDSKYRVIDRNAMDKILKEQNFSNSDRADATSAAKIGRILGEAALRAQRGIAPGQGETGGPTGPPGGTRDRGRTSGHSGSSDRSPRTARPRRD